MTIAVTSYEQCAQALTGEPVRWLVTGAAGFIGSHLVERLLTLGQRVIGLDDLSTGRRANVDAALAAGGSTGSGEFELVVGDVRDRQLCRRLCERVDLVLHQAALGSVPRSIEDPIATDEVNVGGTLAVFVAARDAGVRRVVYASSSAVYGDREGLPKVEHEVGRSLSPYALSKKVGEDYARLFEELYSLQTVGLRYFNVFGPRQDPEGAYAAVIPRWLAAIAEGRPCEIYGDGETSRDFCFVENVVQGNLLAATADWTAMSGGEAGRVYNIACGDRTTLQQLHAALCARGRQRGIAGATICPSYSDFRAGDVRHSLADVTRAETQLGYRVEVPVERGLALTADWFFDRQGAARGG